MSRARFTPVAAPANVALCITLIGRMKAMKSLVEKPGSSVSFPKTAVSPSRKSVGAAMPGIAAPGTRITSLIARRMSSHVPRISPPASS